MENIAKLRNITNGQIQLIVDADDILPRDQKFSTGWQIQDSQQEEMALVKTTTFLENIRTGQFSEISESYLIKNVEEKQHFSSDTFEQQMKDKTILFTKIISKMVLFFEGILAGMCLLQLIILHLTQTLYSSQVFRVDQIIRITAFTSTFGSIFVVLSSYRACNIIVNLDVDGEKKCTAIQLNELRKQYLGSIFSCVFYVICWILLNISHRYAIQYNMNATKKQPWSQLQIAYMAFAMIGWLSSVVNSNYMSI